MSRFDSTAKVTNWGVVGVVFSRTKTFHFGWIGVVVAIAALGLGANAWSDQIAVEDGNSSNRVIVATPARLAFGTQTAGVTSANTRTLTLRNFGPKTRHIDSVQTTGNYAVAGNTCTGDLKPKTSCQITVSITPRCPGNQPGTLEIFHDSRPAPRVVSLSATAVAPSGTQTNQVLLTGGLNLSGPLASAELFDPGSCKFTATGQMTVARAFQTATYLDPAVVSGPEAGQVLITGGQTDSVGDVTAAAELYDPLTKTFTRTVHPMNYPRAGHSATLMKVGPLAGKVLVIGGESMQGSDFKAMANAEIYDPSSGAFTATAGSMNVARSQHRATLISGCNCAQEGDVLVTGGYDTDPSGGPNDTAEVFDPGSQTFTCVGGTGSKYACADVMSSPRWEHGAAMLANGTILISGGDTISNSRFPGDATRTTDIYNPATGAMTSGPDMHLPRNGQQVALIPGGAMQNDLLVTGGFGDHQHNTGSTAEIFNPSSNTFQCVGNRPGAKLCRDAMIDPRATQATTVFSGGALNGLILVSGGIDMTNQAILRSAEVFNPGAKAFMKVGDMISPRNEHTATELP
jgi:hypothetical protein